jgi:hypothetical protein
VLKHLKATQFDVLVLYHEDVGNTLKIWVDSSKPGRATTGAVVFWQGTMLESWSKTQGVVTLSTCESELIAMTSAAQEGRLLQQIMERVLHEPVPLTVFSDSSSAEAFTKKLGVGRIRHLEIRELWIQEQVQKHGLKIQHCDGVSNLADIFTKGFDVQRFLLLKEMIGMRSSVTVAQLQDSINMVGQSGPSHSGAAASPQPSAKARAAAVRGETVHGYGSTAAATGHSTNIHVQVQMQVDSQQQQPRHRAPATEGAAPHTASLQERQSAPTVRQIDYLTVLLHRQGMPAERIQQVLREVRTKAEATILIARCLGGVMVINALVATRTSRTPRCEQCGYPKEMEYVCWSCKHGWDEWDSAVL